MKTCSFSFKPFTVRIILLLLSKWVGNQGKKNPNKNNNVKIKNDANHILFSINQISIIQNNTKASA